MLDVLLDALLDSLKLLPFLLGIYIIIEVIEQHSVQFFKSKHQKYQRLGPVIGSSFGLIPQCGFGLIATNLFSKKFISIGTLAAIYISTSDEAIPIILSHPDQIKNLLPFLLIKFFFAIIVGYIFDFIYRKNKRKNIVENVEANDEKGCCNHHLEKHEDENVWQKYLLHPLVHSLKIFIYILAINIFLGSIIFWIGEDKIAIFLDKTIYLQPLFTIIIGLIPNCASSVIITELYIAGQLTFGACLAGLSVNSGIAFTLLFKTNKNQKENISLLFGLIIASLILGYILTFIV